MIIAPAKDSTGAVNTMAKGVFGSFFFMLHADIKVIVALNCMIAGEHELHALRVSLLYDRLILAHAFEPLFDLPFAHHDVESGHEARLWWIERNLTLELGLTEIEPSFRRFVRLD